MNLDLAANMSVQYIRSLSTSDGKCLQGVTAYNELSNIKVAIICRCFHSKNKRFKTNHKTKNVNLQI